MSAIDPRAGQAPRADELVDLAQLVAAYHNIRPDPAVADQRVAFGTSGHRGSSFDGIGIDTHALSEPAFESALEVLAANHVDWEGRIRMDPSFGLAMKRQAGQGRR